MMNGPNMEKLSLKMFPYAIEKRQRRSVKVFLSKLKEGRKWESLEGLELVKAQLVVP